MLRRLEELCNLNGVSGDEGRVRRYIKNIAKDYADDVWVDTMGNLYAHKRGEGKKVVVAAHMDEVGMIIWGAMENGLLIYQ
ncbi:MAG: M42 family peptidase, partial [Firmicutes bacterium]|nr:M42 family peptidase [Bacillota bacterium]